MHHPEPLRRTTTEEYDIAREIFVARSVKFLAHAHPDAMTEVRDAFDAAHQFVEHAKKTQDLAYE